MLALVAMVILQTKTSVDYREDFDLLSDTIEQQDAYVRLDRVDLKELRKRYRDQFAHVEDKRKLLSLFESYVGELHDFHASLGVNTDHSPRLVPSGTDLFGRWDGTRAYVDQVRKNSFAQKAHFAAGDELVYIGDVPVRTAAAKSLSNAHPSLRDWDWALNSILAGRWGQIRVFTVRHQGQLRKIQMKTYEEPTYPKRLVVEERAGGILYVRPENSLGQDGLIADFDALVPNMRRSKAIVLDLRNTPSGGTSRVARGIMGLFISKRLPFQRHKVEERQTDTIRDWVEYASPRLVAPVTNRLFVLVGRWTGSMGEGLAIGFDAMNRAEVIGSRMAGLRGAIDGLDLPKSVIRVFMPTEQVFHINGTPRHEWAPEEAPQDGTADPEWGRAVQIIDSHTSGPG